MRLLSMLFLTVNAFPIPQSPDEQKSLDQGLEVQVKVITTRGPKVIITKQRNPKRSFSFTDFISDGLLAGVSLLDEAIPKVDLPIAEKLQESKDVIATGWQEEISPLFAEDLLISTEVIPTTTFNASGNFTYGNATEIIDLVNGTFTTKSTAVQNVLDEDGFNNEVEEIEVKSNAITTTASVTTDKNVTQQTEKESQEESEEEEQDFVQSLVSSFLSGLSTPEGAVDVDSVVGLIGGLSVPKGDGTYDFSGLTETLQSFLGGDAENGGGGSDVGKFLGGLISAIIQGSAKPPGAKGAGILSGTLLTGVIPGLSAPPPPPEGSEAKPEQGLDSAGFFQGLIKSVLASSGGNNNKNSTTNGWNKSVNHAKQSLFKSIFTLFSSTLSKLSAKPAPAWNKNGRTL